MRRSSVLTAAVATSAVLISTIVAQPALAAVTGYATTTRHIGGGSTVNVRTAPDVASPIATTLGNGVALSIDCQTTGSQLGFSAYSANRTWDRLTGGQYIHDVVTTTPGGARTSLPDGGYVAWSAGIPRCAGAAAPAATGNYRVTTQSIGGGASVNLRSAPSVTAEVLKQVANGQAVAIRCQTVGSKLGFSKYSDNRTWDLLTTGGYVHDVVTTTPGDRRVNLTDGGYVTWTDALPKCTPDPVPSASSEGSKATAWAANEVGHAWATNPADIDTNWKTEGYWAGEWSGDCLRYVQKAWGHTARPLGTNYATAGALYQARKSQLSTNPAAPIGAIWVWDNTKPAVGSSGHAALSDGNGGIYTTVGRDHTRKPVAHETIAQLGYGQPAGWFLP